MKNYLLFVLFIALFTISNSSSAQTIPGVFPRYNYLDNSENTSTVKLITTARLRNFQIVIDDSIKLRILGSPVFSRFAIRNVPVGNYKIVVLQNKLWPFKERYKYSFTIQSNGDGGEIFVELPKRRYCNAYKIASGGIVAACGVWIYLFNQNWKGR
jgi:hypothetical protein